jgi:RNA recognition motif-containing protein
MLFQYEDLWAMINFIPGEHELKLRPAPDTKQTGNGPPQGGSSSPEKKVARVNPRKGRLIVRNLSFKATEESLRAAFAQYGELSELNILKKPNGQMVGCAFVQYKKINHASKAILEMNAKPFLGRPVAVDWAVPKEVFQGKNTEVRVGRGGGIINI